MAKSKVFKGLAATFAFIVPVAAYMSVLAYDREGDINLFLGITAGAAANQGSYASAYDSKEAMIEAETEYEIATMAEGSVLLRNENSALPLTNKKVTLFGNASVYSNYHGGSGGPSNTGFTLLEALKEEGFEVNQTVYDKIKANGYQAKNKDIAEVDPAIYDASDIGDYKDAAIVVFSRFGGEENDLDLEDSYGVPELSFHERERQTMEFVKAQGFDKVIVLLNTGYVMETGWLKDYCDAALWIAFPGSFGFKGVAQILDGKQNPSGRLVDLYAEDIMSSPAMANWGNFGFSDLPNDNYHHEYVVYAENIYVGYKYYETRYADLVHGVHNANCAKGLKASSTTWNYADEVVFPFGYGLSYTDFSTTFESLDWDRANHSVEAKVTVKNEGSVAGKYSVPLYVSAPYIDGGVEKSAIQLIGYEKTSLLEAGASETLTIVCEDKLFASYDETATNGADSTKTGCYVFDEGDYYFAIGEDSHDALNNALAKSGATGMTDQDGNAVAGDATKSFIETLSERDNTSHATSLVTGEVVSNLFQEVNVNYYIPGAVTYMTRSDWNTYPVAFGSLKADDDASGTIRKHMTATSSLYKKPADAPSYTTFKHSQDVTIMFKDLASVKYDDDGTWETFIDQLKPAELASICGEKMANDAIKRVGYPTNTSCDGPDGLQGGGRLHPSETLAAATFNKELIKQRGEFLGEDALYGGMSMVYGGGCNTHRSPYSGRNFEYYSEDSTVSYIAGRVQGAAMSSKGLLGAFKHFLGNDQETNRHGVATFMTEQALREGDARAFEGALTKGAALANMGAYNRIGLLPTSSCKALMTDMLRNEWGFEGISITDSSKDATTYIFTPEAIEAGTTLFNNDANRANDCKDLLVKQRDGYMWQCVREQAKNFFYAYSKSNVMNHFTSETSDDVSSGQPWWKGVVVGLNVTLGSLLILSLGGYVTFSILEKRKAKEAI